MKKFLLVSALVAGLFAPTAALAHDRLVKNMVVGCAAGYVIVGDERGCIGGLAIGAVVTDSRHNRRYDRYQDSYYTRRDDYYYRDYRRWDYRRGDRDYCRRESEYRRGDRDWYRGCMDRHEDYRRSRY